MDDTGFSVLVVLDPRRGLGRNTTHEAKPQIASGAGIHDLPVRTFGVKFGKGFDVFRGVGVHAGKKISGLPLRAHREADGFVTNIHAVGGFDRDTPLEGCCKIRTA